MKRLLCLSLAFGLAVVASPVLAQSESFEDYYKDALQEDGYGTTDFDKAQLMFMNGDAYEACDMMERARLHFETVEKDMQAMDEMVHDPANGYSQDDQDKAMDWIHQQQAILDPLAATMAKHYTETCQNR